MTSHVHATPEAETDSCCERARPCSESTGMRLAGIFTSPDTERAMIEEPQCASKVTNEMLAELVAGILGEAETMHGPIPAKVEAFVREFGSS